MDKNAIINAAQKYASQGKLDEAIAEWSKLLSVSKDGNIYNTIGDLCLKKRSLGDAIGAFTHAADIFRDDGFYPKAMALYKKILNIEKDNVDALTALAELNAEKGFTSQAVVDLKKIAELHTQQGAPEKSLAVYEKVLHYVPFDVSVKTKMAEQCTKMGLSQRAAQSYESIASNYAEKGDFEKSREFYLKALEIDENNRGALSGLSKLADRDGDQGKSIEYLTRAISVSPDDTSLLLRHARLSIKNNNPDQARDTLIKLIEQSPKDLDAKKMLGTLFVQEGQLDDAWEYLKPCIDEFINSQSWPDAFALLSHFEDIHTIPVKERFISLYRGKGDNDSLYEELKTIAALYETKGDHDDALELLREAWSLNEEDGEIYEKITALEGALSTAQPEQDSPPQRETGEENPEAEVQTADPSAEDPGLSREYIEAKKTEAAYYVEQGLLEDAIKIYEELLATSPDNEEIRQAMESLKMEAPAEEAPAAEIQDTSIPDQAADPEAERQVIAAPPESATDINTAMNEILQEMDTAESTVEADDFEAHYQKGLDYRHRGKIDEAIQEIEIAISDEVNVIRNMRMLALCYMDKGDFASAVATFQKTLSTMSPQDSGYIHLQYALADAFKNNGDDAAANAAYKEIYDKDPAFRDVAEKLGLQVPHQQPPPSQSRRTGEKPDFNQEQKKSRIAYI
ncbi:MAG: tetratricopeptide repeat protein [Nitrospiraceae bacterium]|nr:MAG: tetratricopeptide repeat protein [Nitrospiraceae bacterium]